MPATSCRVLDEVGIETLIVVAAGCKISAIEVEAMAILCSLAATWVESVLMAFIICLRVGSDSSSVIKPSSENARSVSGWAFFLFLIFSLF